MTRPYRKAGVYQILYVPSGEKYIGGSTDISNRFTHHRYMLRRVIHKCKRLQLLWDISSEEDFRFEIIESCDNDKIIVSELEQGYLEYSDLLLMQNLERKRQKQRIKPGKRKEQRKVRLAADPALG